MLFLPPSFTGDSSSYPRRDQRGRSAVRKRNLQFSDEGILVDEQFTHQAEQEAARDAARQKAVKVSKRAASHPSRPPRVNYDTMSSVDYFALRQAD
jgi:hypothetical protein